MKILAIDVGGHHVKILLKGEAEPRKFESGPEMTVEQMVEGVKQAAEGWDHEVIALGYPGPVLRGRPISEPNNLAPGWVGFDFEAAFGCPVKIMNDAAMQALGSYNDGRMLFLGLGTGLGSAMIVDGVVEPMELAHLPYRKGTFEDYVGQRGMKRIGKKKWRKQVTAVVEDFIHALEPTDVVIGGGNVKKLKDLPPDTRAGDNANAFQGGFRLWEDGGAIQTSTFPVHGGKAARKQPEEGQGGDGDGEGQSSSTDQPSEPASRGQSDQPIHES